MRRRAEQVELGRVRRVGRSEGHLAGAHAEIEHVAVVQRDSVSPSAVTLPGAADIDDDQFAAVEEGRRAGRLDRRRAASAAAERHRAADDHPVEMRIGEPDLAGREQVLDQEVRPQLVGADSRGRRRIDRPAGFDMHGLKSLIAESRSLARRRSMRGRRRRRAAALW